MTLLIIHSCWTAFLANLSLNLPVLDSEVTLLELNTHLFC